tara:strand:- start:334 stop:822 length:489 start_codon:yes stop_codon:yes gene_type:complete
MDTIKNLGLYVLELSGVNNYDRITPNIYLGNYKASQKDNFDTIINCSKYLPFHHDKTYNHRIPVNDDLSNNSNLLLLKYMIESLPIINEHVKRNKRILVHCKAGMQRSAAVVAAYLMKYENYTLKDAKKFVISKRNVAFMSGSNFNLCLHLFNKHLHNTTYS